MTSEILQTLDLSAKGLLMPSESDYPFEPFFWEREGTASITPEKFLELSGNSPDTPLEEISLEYLFRNVAFEKEWHDEFQRANVTKFQSLITTIKQNLQDVKVYRVGTIDIDVYIIGSTNNGLAGLKTKLIET